MVGVFLSKSEILEFINLEESNLHFQASSMIEMIPEDELDIDSVLREYQDNTDMAEEDEEDEIDDEELEEIAEEFPDFEDETESVISMEEPTEGERLMYQRLAPIF